MPTSSRTPVVEQVLDLWERGLRAVRTGDHTHGRPRAGLGDQAVPHRPVRATHGLHLDDPRIARLDLAYHDISRTEGLYHLLPQRGLVERVTTDVEVFEATAVPPQTTRAKLRGDFVRGRPGGAGATTRWTGCTSS